MKRLVAVVLSVASIAASADDAPQAGIAITHPRCMASVKGATQRFNGDVRIDMLFQAEPPSRLSGGMVTFEPGARTAWHTHPLGQTLIVTAGKGWVQPWDGEKREIVAGDIVSIPARVKHWHGATATTGMTHIALQEALDGKNVEWLEQVADEQYRKP
ncbi:MULTISPECIES: (R)-mandelonitrile lyase [Caballeronia]|uniref:(R)-mandelonitrile lyase n=1 Tax=Caballeronia TaxID=1827195 RepID=UPI003857CEE9